ncbi:MAG: CHAT domain-containing protein, partial [Saprospiraceae bacterium]|nr:CHAT domain-containing protein [Saprospiraceae bacterium]
PLASEQYFQIHTEPSATTKDLTRYIAEFKDRIAVFHYGGHAGSEQIFLTDVTANASGLAQLLAAQPNLNLVFLNGCSTKAQVDLLLELGVPAVIATSVPVSDPGAKDFADVFYKSMAAEHSIESAFKLAAANYLLLKGEAVGIYRGISLHTPDQEKETLPWGLYVKKDKDAALDWKLPRKSASSFIVRGAGRKYEANRAMNQRLIETIANAIAPYSEIINDMVESARRSGREPRLRDLRAAVVDAFPTPIGTHLRKLLLLESAGVERLSKIVEVFTVSSELLAYILLAQLWDEKFRLPGLNIPDEQKQAIKAFFEMKEGNWETYDHLALIRAVADVFAANNIPTFITEFNALREQFYAESGFQLAQQFLQEMKQELLGAIAADEIESFCVQAEDHLCEIFRHIGFCAKYKLATVKTIELLKRRHEVPRYRHNIVVLDKVSAGVLDDVLESDVFSDNNSVVLLHSDDAVSPFLNLSPFLIDENALKGQQNSKLFFFRYISGNQFTYVLADTLKDRLDLDAGLYEPLKQQFDTFFRIVL